MSLRAGFRWHAPAIILYYQHQFAAQIGQHRKDQRGTDRTRQDRGGKWCAHHQQKLGQAGAHGACGVDALLLQGQRVEQALGGALGFGGAGVQRVGHAAMGVQALAVALCNERVGTRPHSPLTRLLRQPPLPEPSVRLDGSRWRQRERRWNRRWEGGALTLSAWLLVLLLWLGWWW